MHPEDVWAASDYTPTARRLTPAAEAVAERAAVLAGPGARAIDVGAGHGAVSRALVDRGMSVVAVEPVAAMREVGARAVPEATWTDATGEDTGLPDACADVVASSFGTMFCDPATGPAEWARVLAPGGALVMTAWDDHGFLAEMTRRMFDVMYDGNPPSAHMDWGDDGWARERLTGHFSDIAVEHLEMPWRFASVEDGMDLYLHGSPSHTFSLRRAGDKRGAVLAALEEHLRENERDGRIDAVAGYSLITARRT